MTLDRPTDPIKGVGPVVIARRRPATVTLAGLLLCVSGAVGAVTAVALLLAAGGVVDDFGGRARSLGVPSAQSAEVAGALRTALVSSGVGTLVLAGLSVVLGWGVLARNGIARAVALVVCAASLGCAVVRTGVTALGGGVDWSGAAGYVDPGTTGRVAQAFDDAMPGWLVGLAGGLTDLQSLGDVLVVGLLLAPTSVLYFRRLRPPEWAGPRPAGRIEERDGT